MTDVIHDNEIFLGDMFFPIRGPVQITNITVTPNPVIFGDTSRTGETQVMAQLIQSSHVGGSGIYKGDPRTDTERCWISGAETRYRNMLCLPPLAFNMGLPSGVASEPLALCFDFQNVQFFVFANKVYTWLDATQSWSTLEHTLSGVPTDVVVFKNKVYLACGAAIESRDMNGNWTTDTDDATLIAEWDSRLWKLAAVTNAWEISYSSDGATWTAAGQFTAPNAPHQFIVYRDATGASALYLLTDSGPWIYDATNQRFLETEVRVPRVEPSHNMQAAVFRDGKMYFTSGGLGMVSVQSGNPTVVAPMGLDQDDGVPGSEFGRFHAITADFGWLLALVNTAGNQEIDVSQSDEDWITMGGPFESWDWPLSGSVSGGGQAKLKAWQGGWHTLWESQFPGPVGSVLVVSGAYNKHRIYWAQGESAYFMDVPNEIHNPRHNPNPRFAQGPVEHLTPWWSYGSEVQEKIHGHFYIRTSGCSPTERVRILYGLDLDDTTFTEIAEITTNGHFDLPVNGAVGKPGRFFRFKFILERGSDDTKSPFVEFYASEIMRLLPATYAFGINLDLTSEHRGQDKVTMLNALKRLADPKQTPNMIPFAYQDESVGVPQTFYGKISRLSGQEQSGTDLRGTSDYLVSFVAPYSQDTT